MVTTKKWDQARFMREQHARANLARQYCEQKTGKKGDYWDFLRKDDQNPASQLLVAYHVDFRQDYNNTRTGNEFYIEREDFVVYVPLNEASPDMIEDEVRQRVSEIFKHPNKVNAIYNGKTDLEINVKQLRGMEKADELRANGEVFGDISKKGVHVSKTPEVRTKKGGTSSTYRYTLDTFN